MFLRRQYKSWAFTSTFILLGIVTHETSLAAVSINSLPFTISQSGETYVLASDLTQGAGDGITVSADNVIIDGNNKTLTYCETGVVDNKCAGINITGRSNIEIYNLDLQQGSYNIGSGQYGYAIRGSGAGINLHDNTLNLIARRDATDLYGVKITTTGPGNELSFSTLNITGQNRMKAHDASSGSKWLVHDNTILVSSLTQPNPGRYSRLFYMGGGSEYYDNDINIDANSEAVNVFVSWNRSNGKIYNNNINYASSEGRVIILDNGSQNYEVFNNIFSVASQSGATYVIRVRDDGTAGSSNHRIHHNTIDAENSSNVNAVSLGNSSANNTGNRFYYNIIKSSRVPVQFYGNTTSDTDFFCNQIIHTGTSGHAIKTSRSNHTDITFSNNIVTTNRTDDKLAFFDADLSGTGQWRFCETEITSTDIAGNAPQTDFIFSNSPCQDGIPLCANDAGASLVPLVRPGPNEDLIAN